MWRLCSPLWIRIGAFASLGYALIASGLRNVDRMHRASEINHHADASEVAWRFGFMSRRGGRRAMSSLHILAEAVK